MHQIATIPSAAAAFVDEHDIRHMQSNPLNTATGFVLGGLLSSALWAVAGVAAWYLI